MSDSSTLGGRLRLLGRKLNRRYHRRLGRQSYNERGVDIFECDWDNLLVLDACRYDLLAGILDEQHGPVDSVVSRGSSTFEFLQGNVAGRDLHDTVYVTANPVLHRNRSKLEGDTSFHDELNVWLREGWDDESGTVLPEAVSESAVEAAEQYPNKRLLIHYMQPHYPFISSDLSLGEDHLENESRDINFWKRATIGQLDLNPDEVWEAYAENLREVLPEALELGKRLDGKSVITADHGNVFGERATPIPVRDWGHPPGIYTDELVTVPWVELPSASRKRVVEGDQHTVDSNPDKDLVEERLHELGYVE